MPFLMTQYKINFRCLKSKIEKKRDLELKRI